MAATPRAPAAAAAAAARILALALPLLLLLPPPAALLPAQLGGVQDSPVDDPGVQEAAAFAVLAYSKASPGPVYFKELRIVKAASQVVEGMKYFLTVEVVSTQCEKKSGVELTEAELQLCPIAPRAEQQRYTCHFTVWSRPWLNELQLLGSSCVA
ncbi:cystatin-like [Varanus komodoensis]|uniref:cystatin-like n=1 Tax=Varanus komodoensis TaxID=61221 RepID=UPI001CF77E7C|nr:cystatin-like [Varanus komodoensis]